MDKNENRKFEPFDIVKHFKREQQAAFDPSSLLYYYKIVGDGIDVETNEMVMIYEALYWPYQKFVRKYDEFMEDVMVGEKLIPRFEKVRGEELAEVIKKIRR